MAGVTLDQLPQALGLNGNELFWIYQQGNNVTPWIGLSCTTAQIAKFALNGGSLNQGRLAYAARNLNLNATGDTPVTILLPPGVVNYRVTTISVANSAGALPTTATLGVYTAPSAGGFAMVTGGHSVLSGITSQANATTGNSQALTMVAATTTAFNNTTLYVNVGIAQGSASTIDVILTLDLL
jgi:hypothetical protein